MHFPKGAKKYAQFIAHRIGTEKPSFAKPALERGRNLRSAEHRYVS